MKAKKYYLKKQTTTKKVKFHKNDTKSNLMNCTLFHPCHPAFYLQTTASGLLYKIFLFKKVVYLVAFGDITWK